MRRRVEFPVEPGDDGALIALELSTNEVFNPKYPISMDLEFSDFDLNTTMNFSKEEFEQVTELLLKFHIEYEGC